MTRKTLGIVLIIVGSTALLLSIAALMIELPDEAALAVTSAFGIVFFGAVVVVGISFVRKGSHRR